MYRFNPKRQGVRPGCCPEWLCRIIALNPVGWKRSLNPECPKWRRVIRENLTNKTMMTTCPSCGDRNKPFTHRCGGCNALLPLWEPSVDKPKEDPYKGFFVATLECHIPTTDEDGSCLETMREYLHKNPSFAAEYMKSLDLRYQSSNPEPIPWPPRPAWMIGSPECDWREDAGRENGNYFRKCICCASDFIGHKRRHVCRRCHQQGEEVIASMTESERAEHIARRDAAIATYVQAGYNQNIARLGKLFNHFTKLANENTPD